jgi:hypothetical protein
MRDLESETAVEGGGWRRRRPPRQRARSPEGECVAVEWLSDDVAALSLTPSMRWRSSERTARHVQSRGMHQNDAGGGDDGG